MKFKPEYLALVMNIGFLIYYVHKGEEIGKIIYWFGAIILTVGLIKMQG